ncbi:hypothetical protein [Dyella mobilis]|uniref:Uncharacterized protein n=1 Tax=Dyella mobilis TaxID=1849582 RepID=A0ABS2KKU3_9GAMM|nr:hypothetical protein [Dyella mobilis]MBM7131545.1 hypothetical protein [Dyella mobilis]GLQ96484.1 hypothetical protein GCM10007863_09020 [Dyella mobilis]
MRSIRLAIIALFFALFAGNAFASQSVTDNVTAALLYQDLDTYVMGGKSYFSDPWQKAVVPYQMATDIAQKYVRQPIGADQEFKGKIAFIHAIFITSDNWLGDTYRVQFQTFVGIFKKEDATFLANASSGTPVNIACEVTGKEIDGFPWGENCRDAQEVERELITSIMAGKGVPNSPLGKMHGMAVKITAMPGITDACSGNFYDGLCINAIQSATANAPPKK